MDPNATLRELLELAAKYAERNDDYDRLHPEALAADAARFAELTTALDGWLSSCGGFLPDRWTRLQP